MTWSGRSILAAGVALGLSACNFLEGMDLSLSRIGCAVFSETKVGAVNWDTAWSVNMRIRQGEYRPVVLGFTAERPYVLRIANADDSDRMFRASGFFDSVAVGLVRVAGIMRQRASVPLPLDHEKQPRSGLLPSAMAAMSLKISWYLIYFRKGPVA